MSERSLGVGAGSGHIGGVAEGGDLDGGDRAAVAIGGYFPLRRVARFARAIPCPSPGRARSRELELGYDVAERRLLQFPCEVLQVGRPAALAATRCLPAALRTAKDLGERVGIHTVDRPAALVPSNEAPQDRIVGNDGRDPVAPA